MANSLSGDSPRPSVSPGSHDLTDYLSNADKAPLPLLPGTSDAFSELSSILSQYKDVIARKESLAAILGAKLKGPRLVRGLDNFFEGTISVTPLESHQPTIKWSDIILFAKTNDDFKLARPTNGTRRYNFCLKGCRVSISEDDWRLICSGAFNGMPLSQSFEDDEASELATLDIVGERASILQHRAEDMASQTRDLQDKISQRKEEIRRRRQHQDPIVADAKLATDLRAELLKQFAANAPIRPLSRSVSESLIPMTSASDQGPCSQYSSMRDATNRSQDPKWRARQTNNHGPAHDAQDPVRRMVMRKADTLAKGEPLEPPCDRCRRLHYPCLKHMTACQACTKKHARCSWKNTTEEEYALLQREVGFDAKPRGPPITRTPDNVTTSYAGTESSRSPDSHTQGTSIPASAYMRDPSADFGFELAPIKIRTSLPSEPNLNHPTLPRLIGSSYSRWLHTTTNEMQHTEDVRRPDSQWYGA